MENNNLEKDKNIEVQSKSENINNKNNENFIKKIEKNKIIQPQPIKNVLDLKKEIFDNRKFIRWTSFYSIFSIICLGLFALFFWLDMYLAYIGNKWMIQHQNWWVGTPNSSNEYFIIDGKWYNIPWSFNNSYFYIGGEICFSISFVFCGIGGLFLLISWVSNCILLTKINSFKKTYLPFFILSFIIPFLTWLYCMGLIAFMKHKNKANYYEWLKETKVKKYSKKQLKYFR